eukprot:11154672-Lingulodinium_polyedra.AAC.1
MLRSTRRRALLRPAGDGRNEGPRRAPGCSLAGAATPPWAQYSPLPSQRPSRRLRTWPARRSG